MKLSEHQTSAKPEPTAKYSWWNSKENKEFIYRNFVGATQKIKQATKYKTNRLASNALLGPSKRRKRRVCRYPTPSDSDTDLAVPFDDDSTEEEQDADCTSMYSTGRFSEDHKEECLRCATCFRWVYTLSASMEEDLICWPCQG